MSDTIKLPPCRLCGQPPVIVEWLPYAETRVYCASPGCGICEDRMTADEWRRLHGPRLAPEHSETMHTLLALMIDRPRYAAAIRAALAASVEEER